MLRIRGARTSPSFRGVGRLWVAPQITQFGLNLPWVESSPNDLWTRRRDQSLARKSTFTTRYQTLKALLVKARRDAGLTQSELAAKLSRPQSFVSKYERGERRLDLIEFLEVTNALGARPEQFIKALR